jgi:hypothetical protein
MQMLARLLIALVAATWFSQAAFAEGRAVDPSKVAPEHREAAIKRAAEQKKLAECRKQADVKKLRPRERVEFLIACFDN